MTKTATLKYPVKIGKTTFARGLEVRLATLDEVRKVFEKMQQVDDSEQVGVWFPGLDHPTLVHKDQLVP